jgi:nicotinamidase-related amidase
VELGELAGPGAAALITQECQRGVVGPDSLLPELATAAAPALPRIAELAAAARRADVPVIHCVAATRPGRRGEPGNAPLYRAVARSGRALLPGTPAVEIAGEIGLGERDLVITRFGGIGPMYDTGLELLLRRLGVRTVVVTGVSVNVAILDLVLDSVNAGFDVVLPRDAVAGVPAGYADLVIDHTLRLLAKVVRAEDILACWKSGPQRS